MSRDEPLGAWRRAWEGLAGTGKVSRGGRRGRDRLGQWGRPGLAGWRWTARGLAGTVSDELGRARMSWDTGANGRAEMSREGKMGEGRVGLAE